MLQSNQPILACKPVTLSSLSIKHLKWVISIICIIHPQLSYVWHSYLMYTHTPLFRLISPMMNSPVRAMPLFSKLMFIVYYLPRIILSSLNLRNASNSVYTWRKYFLGSKACWDFLSISMVLWNCMTFSTHEPNLHPIKMYRFPITTFVISISHIFTIAMDWLEDLLIPAPCSPPADTPPCECLPDNINPVSFFTAAVWSAEVFLLHFLVFISDFLHLRFFCCFQKRLLFQLFSTEFAPLWHLAAAVCMLGSIIHWKVLFSSLVSNLQLAIQTQHQIGSCSVTDSRTRHLITSICWPNLSLQH